MPESEAAVAEQASIESQEVGDKYAPREISTPLEEIFKKVMPYEHELEEQKAASEGEPATPTPQTDKKPVQPTPEPSAPIPGLPDELFGDPKPKEIPTPEEVEPVAAQTPKEFKGKTKEHFENLSKKEFETAKLNRQLQKRLQEAESKAQAGDPDAKARIQQLETQLSQYKERIYAADATLDPEFEARFTIPRNHHLEVAKKAYANAGGNPKDIERALTATEEARAEQLSEIYGTVSNEYLKTKLQRAVDAVETIDSQIAGVMQNRETWLKQTNERRQVERSKFYEQHEAETKKGLADATRFLEDSGWEVFKETSDPKTQWWNDQRKKVVATAEDVLLKTNDQQSMRVGALLMASAPIYRAMALNERQGRLKAEALLKEYKGSEPGLGGESEVKQTGNGVNDDDDMLTAIRKRLRGK